ncbi:MAG: hypothetical protein H0W62_09250 [Chitinophagales bacterium]|nr:hypothetical protein [Chitinophagales bacterium]
MKHLLILLAATLIYTGCTQPKGSEMLKTDTQKREIFSSILNDDQLSSELMDSMLIKRHDLMMSKMNSMMTGDRNMQMGMMDNMMSMCSKDSAMCNMMMTKTMDMCDADQSKCNMMMNMAQARPNVQKSMQNMCDMNKTDMPRKRR